MKTRFSKEEKAKLLKTVQQYQRENPWRDKNMEWDKIVEMMGTHHTKMECMRQYESYKQTRDKRPFTQEEDELLIRKVREMGEKFTNIAMFFTDRRPGVLKNRYRLLQIRELDRHSITVFPEIKSLPIPILASDHSDEEEEKNLVE